MRPSTRATRTLALGLLATALLGASTGAAAADPATTTLVPIGSDYQADTLQLFAREAAERPDATDDQVHILVFPITYSLSADGTTKSERKKNLTFAENRRSQIDAACNAVITGTQTCFTQLVPVLVRSDADPFDPAPYFTTEVDGMYVLGGDQTVAMNTVHDTDLEAAMTDAFEAGAVFGGNSAGAAVQSTDMINGYNDGYGPAESLQEDAVQVCFDTGETTCEGGMPFGFENLITDQHVFEYGRTGRSLNVAVSTGKPVLGLDAATGAVVDNYTDLHDVTGDTLAYVIDPISYNSAEAYGGPNDTLRTSNVAMHLLPPGSGFDFDEMTPELDGTEYPQPDLEGRTYPITSTGAGTLYLSGGILGGETGFVGDTFAGEAGGDAARIVVLAAGFAKTGEAQADAKAIAAALEPSVESITWFALDSRTKNDAAIAAINDATGIVVTGRDRSLVLEQLDASPVWDAAYDRWAEDNIALLVDDAAAAAAGTVFAAEAPAADVEAGATEDAIVGNVEIVEGLGLVSGLAVEPRLLPDQLWPQLFQISQSADDSWVGAGIDVGTAIMVDDTAATAIGDSAVVIVDGRQATWTTGDNDAIGAAWLILDTFANDDTVAPVAPLVPTAP
jgi:cyanophycinase-like exopeptidase